MTSNSDQSPRTESAGVGTEPASTGNTTKVPRARLTRLKINRFRHVKPGTELRFDDGINVLLGRNGTGKTTLLELVCALARGDLSAYQHESFDLEFDMQVGDHRYSVAAQQTTSIANSLARLGGGQPLSWNYRVEIRGPSGTIATAEATPRTTKITLTVEGGDEITTEEAPRPSPFSVMFYAAPFLRAPVDIAVSVIILFSVYGNCLRLDEGLDVFRTIVDGTILPSIKQQLSMEFYSRMGAPEVDFYAPSELAAHIKAEGLPLHEAMDVAVDQSHFGVLDAVARAIDVRALRCSLMLLDRKQDPATGATVSRFGKPTFWITTHGGTTFTHDKLSYGEKRLLAFMYHAAANPQILIADELVNGLHYEWIQACLDAIQGQAFLTSQNPLLLDHLPFTSAAEAQRRFVLCDRDEHGEWIWRNMDQDAADAFYRAYDVGVQHVSGILRTKGLW